MEGAAFPEGRSPAGPVECEPGLLWLGEELRLQPGCL